jgi:hypothetical protein
VGCDIHWYIERKHPDGSWHTVLSKDYVDDLFWRDPISRTPTGSDARYKLPQYQIGQRNYDLFAILSHVRGTSKGAPALIDGVPDGASQAFIDKIEHTPGWAPGSTILQWAKTKNTFLKATSSRIRKCLTSGLCNTILPPWNEETEAFDENSPMETGHERIQRLVMADELLDWKSDPDAWRFLVHYDS